MAKTPKKVSLNEITAAYNAMHEALNFYKAGIDNRGVVQEEFQ